MWFCAAAATEFAPLSHMLMNGFFFIQGLIICWSFSIVEEIEIGVGYCSIGFRPVWGKNLNRLIDA